MCEGGDVVLVGTVPRVEFHFYRVNYYGPAIEKLNEGELMLCDFLSVSGKFFPAFRIELWCCRVLNQLLVSKTFIPLMVYPICHWEIAIAIKY